MEPTYNNFEEALKLKLDKFYLMARHRLFNRALPTAIYFHGWTDNGEEFLSPVALRGAYRHVKTHNFITVDWNAFSTKNYISAIKDLQVMGETFAEKLLEFLQKGGYDVRRIHLVGHSLGAQVTGLIGRTIKKITNGKVVIPRIFALDPALPCFELPGCFRGFVTISRDDAAYVQIIHTNSGILGVRKSAGHVDFFPNGGHQQVGCEGLSDYSCHHARAYFFFQESVRNPRAFQAVRCNSFDDFKANRCYSITEYMGFGANINARGEFYLRTQSDLFEASLGADGTKNQELKIFGTNGLFKTMKSMEEGNSTNAESYENRMKNIYSAF